MLGWVDQHQAPAAVDGTVPPGFAAQCRLAWANVFGVLGEAGMTVRNLAKITVYLADRRFRETNALIAEEILGGHCPARTVVIAGTDDEAWLLAIEAVAYG